MSHLDVPHGTFWTHTTCSFPLRRTNYIVPAEKPISYEHDLALPHIHPHPHRENVWKYPLFPARPFGRCRLARLPHQTHIAYDACIPSQNNDLRFYNRNFANGDFGADEEFCNPWCMTHKQAVIFMRRAGHARPLHGRWMAYLVPPAKYPRRDEFLPIPLICTKNGSPWRAAVFYWQTYFAYSVARLSRMTLTLI